MWSVDPSGEDEKSAHLSQVALPVLFLYVPVSHIEQSPPSAPVYPALHLQAYTLLLARGEELWSWHC